MRETGGFVAAGLPVSAGGLDATDRAGLVLFGRRATCGRFCSQLGDGPLRGWGLIALVEGHPGPGRRETGETAHTSRAGRRCVRLTLLCGANRTDLEPRGAGCAFSRAAMGVAGGPGPAKRKNRCSPDEVCRDVLGAYSGPE